MIICEFTFLVSVRAPRGNLAKYLNLQGLQDSTASSQPVIEKLTWY